ncbi:hypothetical protein [Microvirga thermotolerans]|uniref:Porin n=1 Tax=Microvirga thermotolerans TaxID=2651334 RepID=A0A5P9JY60_9HYPH|nr:hypothetical protein [Microvirga thermotolerans]QFU16688.1 hypothetical protein GDR74_10855 [Microvirga thermotolerans]
MRRPSLAGAALVLVLVPAVQAFASECRMPKAPAGVELQVPPECRQPAAPERSRRESRESLAGEGGFVDLGNGTKVRIGGRVRAEVGVGP